MGRRFGKLAYLAALYWLGLLPARYECGRWLRTDFNPFWSSMGRVPFKSVDEFEIARAFYAQCFKMTEQPMPGSPEDARALWNEDVTVCHLFSFIARREQHPLRFLKWQRWLPWHGDVLEYGAGAAPYADAMTTLWPWVGPSITVADIPWHLHDYQQWRFKDTDRVQVVTLPVPWPAQALFDGILCVETLEHVPDPLVTARHLMGLLKPGGVLVCDYGPQTKNQPLAPQGMTYRAVTLGYLKRAGTLLHDGELLVIRKAPRFELHKQAVA